MTGSLRDRVAKTLSRREFMTRATAFGVTNAAYCLLGLSQKARAAAHADRHSSTDENGGAESLAPPH
jgi:peptide/nickel transport system substrate-binding protein